ncbi:hypothetical protein BRD05_00885 [Halobacteriales archaeon QS_9_70_65]|nr:MAG: hypothetical protein BRD05_00885 [Halobacteriales archaeon QS_9_70_65]
MRPAPRGRRRDRGRRRWHPSPSSPRRFLPRRRRLVRPGSATPRPPPAPAPAPTPGRRPGRCSRRASRTSSSPRRSSPR